MSRNCPRADWLEPVKILLVPKNAKQFLVSKFDENTIDTIEKRFFLPFKNDNFSNIAIILVHGFFSVLLPIELSLFQLLRQQ